MRLAARGCWPSACAALASRARSGLDIRSAYVELAEGVYQLNATLDFEVIDARALRDGSPFTFDLDARVQRDRAYGSTR